jgi:PGF-CTERM protein
MQTTSLVAGACVLVLALAGATVAAPTAPAGSAPTAPAGSAPTAPAGSAQTAPAEPTVGVENASAAPGETTTVDIRLSGAPDGLSGYNLAVALDDGTAALTNASVADGFGLTNTTVSSDTATLEGVDTDGAVGPGDSDILLGTLTLRGEAAGTTDLAVRTSSLDADNASALAHATASATVTVEEMDPDGDTNETDGGNETTDNGSDGSGPGFGVVAAVLAVFCVLVVSHKRQRTSAE